MFAESSHGQTCSKARLVCSNVCKRTTFRCTTFNRTTFKCTTFKRTRQLLPLTSSQNDAIATCLSAVLQGLSQFLVLLSWFRLLLLLLLLLLQLRLRLLLVLITLRTLNYGNSGIFLIMGNAGFIPSTVLLPSLNPVSLIFGFRV